MPDSKNRPVNLDSTPTETEQLSNIAHEIVQQEEEYHRKNDQNVSLGIEVIPGQNNEPDRVIIEKKDPEGTIYYPANSTLDTRECSFTPEGAFQTVDSNEEEEVYEDFTRID